LEITLQLILLFSASGENPCVTNACGGIIKSTTCQIQSPGFPRGFDEALNCYWLIHAPKLSHKLSFHFLDLDLNASDSLCGDNNVTVYDGPNVKAPVILETLCDFERNQLKGKLLNSTGI